MHIVFDVTVFILTTVKWKQHRRDSLMHLDACEKWSGTLGLAELIVRDGVSNHPIYTLSELTRLCRCDVFRVSLH